MFARRLKKESEEHQQIHIFLFIVLTVGKAQSFVPKKLLLNLKCFQGYGL